MRRIGLVAAVAVCFAVVGVQSAFAYVDEGAFLLTTNYSDRSSFIIDEKPVVNPPSFIPQSVFLSAPYLAYYSSYGFDRNFFTWLDPNGSFTPDNKITWSSCLPVVPFQPTHQIKEPDGRLLCDPTFTVSDTNGATIRSVVQTGPVHGFVYTDSNGTIHFVSTVCGNFTHPGPAPPPTITGLKFIDLNRNGVRDTGINGQAEPVGPGFVFDLYYMNQPVKDKNGNQVTATSGADGKYKFTLDADTYTAGGQPIGPGEYEIKEEPQAGYTQTTPPTITVQIPVGSVGQNFQAPDTGNAPSISITTALVPSTPTVPPGTAVHDTAKLVNATSSTGGLVTYAYYSSLQDCQNGVNGTAVAAQSGGVVSGGVVPRSKAVTLTTPGFYYWQAVYLADGVNVTAKSDCGTEIIQVVTPKGHLQICKAGDNGAQDLPFNFTITQGGVVVGTPTVFGGGACAMIDLLPGTTVVTEDLSSGLWVVGGIGVDPSGNVISTDLANGKVTFTLNANETTTVTYTNSPPPPTIRVCKWSNTKALQGQVFNFTVGTTPVSATAGSSEVASLPGCSQAVTVVLGTTVKVTETVPNGVTLQGVDVSPNATLVSFISPVARVKVGPGVNYVYFQDEIPKPPSGYIEVCKDAADQFVSRTVPFNFTITDKTGLTHNEPILAGQCTSALQVAAGPVTVTEQVTPPNMLAAVTAQPSSALGLVTLANGTAIVNVPVSDSPAGEVLVHFLNTTQTGTLKICKTLTATSAALDRQVFTFTLDDASGESTVTVTALAAATQCVIVPHGLPVGSVATVTENAVSFVSGGNGANTPTTKTITIAPGVQSVMFTNQAYGQLSICKQVTGSTSGTFTFDYAGVSSWNTTAGTVHVSAGTCSLSIPVPVDNYTIFEESTSGFSFVSSSAVGPSGASRVVSGTNPVTVSVPYFYSPFPDGGETDVNFVNSVPNATIKACKVIDYYSTASIGGLNYTFKISSVTSSGNTLITSGQVQPPYPTTMGGTAGPRSCVVLGSYALIDTDGNPTKLLVTEVSKTGVQVANITLNGNAVVNTNNPNNNGKITFTLTGPGTIVIMYTNKATPAG